MNKRTNKIVLVVGGRGTGKTTYLENHVPHRAVVVEYFKTDRYKDFEHRANYDNFKLQEAVNRPVILEDATQLIIGGGGLKLRRLAVSCKQLGSDVFIVFHSTNFVPPFLYALFDYMILWRSEAPKKSAKLAAYYDEICKILSKKPPKKNQWRPLGVVRQV